MGAAEETIWELSGLHRRLREIVTTTPKELLDQVPTPDANSIAILVTHLVGSEGEWLNRAAGRSIERDRDSEFRVRGRDARELIAAIEEADRAAPDLIRAAFAAGIETQRDRPGAQPVTVSFCLIHAAAHAAEHVGHADLTKQLLLSLRDSRST
jgi:uncharacterized damage-inducible protein DinB